MSGIYLLFSSSARLMPFCYSAENSNLPMTMARIHSKRRLARLRRALSRWQESARGCAVLHIQKVEQEFQKREAEYIHSGRIVVVKLR